MISKTELAKELNVTTMTIGRWMNKGMPFLKAPNGTVRFELDKVKKWMGGE